MKIVSGKLNCLVLGYIAAHTLSGVYFMQKNNNLTCYEISNYAWG